MKIVFKTVRKYCIDIVKLMIVVFKTVRKYCFVVPP